MKFTANEIIKALEYCIVQGGTCGICPYDDDDEEQCFDKLKKDAIDLINHQKEENIDLKGKVVAKNIVIETQKAEIDKLEYILMGVMHSVDKWLEGAELDHDETNRAVIMREKTLQIVEKQQAELEDYKALYENLKAEHIETIKAIKNVEAEAIKEFLQKQEIELASNTDISAVGYQSIIAINDKILKEIVGDV